MERTTRSGTPERRDHSPPGRLRRIFHDHPTGVWSLIGIVVLFFGLFVATTVWAVNERFKRDITRIAFTHDTRSLRFLAARAADPSTCPKHAAANCRQAGCAR